MGKQKTKPDLDGLTPEVQEYIDSLETTNTTLVDQLDKALDIIEKSESDTPDEPTGDEPEDEEHEDEGGDEEELDKADLDKILKANPALAKHMAKMGKAVAAAEKRATSAESVAKAANDARLDAEYIGKAEELDNLAGDKKELGLLMRRVTESVSKADANALWDVLKSANAQAEAAELFKEIGTDAAAVRAQMTGSTRPKTSFEVEVSKAQAMGKSYDEAVDFVVTTQPGLYEAHATEVKKGR